MQIVDGCDHIVRHQYLETTINDYTGEEDRQWKCNEEYTFVDLDLHRYQCTRCQTIGYYSSAAKAFYEEGVKTPGVQGLE